MKSEQSLDKPHIKKNKHGWWECSGPSVVGLLPTILTANGFTKEEAYEMWRQISDVNEWRLLLRQSFNDPQLNMGTHRHEEIKPFSALRYVETTYSNSSVPLKQLE